MAKATVIVGTDNSNTSTLVRDIPRCWEDDGIRYVVMSDSPVVAVDGRAEMLYDVYIRTAQHPKEYDVGIVTVKGIDAKHLFFTRHGKDQQAVAINKLFADKQGFPEFWPLRTWTSITSMPEYRQGLFVLRPTAGARGIGQLVFDSRKTSFMSIAGALIDMNRNASSFYGDKVEEVSGGIPSSGAYEKFAAYNHKIAQRFAELPGSPIWYSDGDRRQGEGWEIFNESFFIQEYVPNISKEYRIIIGGNNEPAYAVERLRPHYGALSDVNLASASSAEAGIGNAFTTLQAAGLPQSVVDGFTAILREKDFSLYSFDVFLTTDNKWGIFEFSNEFGTESVPNGFVCTEIQKYIRRVTSS